MIAHGIKLVGLIMLGSMATEAAPKPDLPDAGFSGDHYASLWTKSPFAIATPDAPAVSADYRLVGVAKFDGVTYVSLVDKQNQEHFILSSEKPVRNLKFVSVSHGSDGLVAVIQRGSESLTLRPEEEPESPGAPAAPPLAMAPPQNPPGPGGTLPSVGGVIPPAFLAPPLFGVHRRLINVPPRPQQPSTPQPQQQQAPGQPTP